MPKPAVVGEVGERGEAEVGAASVCGGRRGGDLRFPHQHTDANVPIDHTRFRLPPAAHRRVPSP